MVRPTRCRSAARRGPTPFMNCSGVSRGIILLRVGPTLRFGEAGRSRDGGGQPAKLRHSYWTIVAVPVATRISRICEGSWNGSSMLMPSGSSALRE